MPTPELGGAAPREGCLRAHRIRHGLLLAALLGLYLAVSLHGLAIVPPVYEDEPWQASTGWKLATEGTFGSDLFAGLHGMERRHYWFMPVHPLLLAGTFRIAGLGLFQARLEAVLAGLAVLVLTWALGCRLFGHTIGLLAVAFLLTGRHSGLTPSQVSGILFVDVVRIARYDVVVPVFGLASLHAYLSARRRADARWYGLAGLLAGLAGLSHLYGAFWLLALGALALWDRAGWRSLVAMALGFAGPWLLYLIYVLGDLPAWVGQTRQYGPRFDLLNPAFYGSNLLQEPRRYGPGLGPPGWGYLLRPGVWVGLVVIPGSLLVLFVRASRGGDGMARVIVAPALVLPVLFGLLIQLKLANYLVTIMPLAALAAAWGGVTLWRRPGRPWWLWWRRLALGALLLATTTEGASRLVALYRAADTTTPYADFIARVRQNVPPGSRVLALHNYWLGMHDFEYRSWSVPFGQTAATAGPLEVTLPQALDRLAPHIVLIDAKMRGYFNRAAPTDPRPQLVVEWLRRRGYTRVALVQDHTYGAMEIFRQAP